MDPLHGVSRETIFVLRRLEQMLLHWAGRMNLVAASTLHDIWRRHILDSAQLIQVAPEARIWLDLGSGGGFPGLVVAALMQGQSAAHVDLVESSRKKSAFLQAAVNQLELPATVHTTRIELLKEIQTPEVITARALAPLDALLELASPWLQGRARGLFHKGRSHEDEVTKSRERWRFDLIVHASMTDREAAILDITNLRPSAT